MSCRSLCQRSWLLVALSLALQACASAPVAEPAGAAPATTPLTSSAPVPSPSTLEAPAKQPAGSVQLVLTSVTTLRRKTFQGSVVGLEGELSIKIQNDSGSPVDIYPLDVHGLVFEDAQGAPFILAHSCDCVRTFDSASSSEVAQPRVVPSGGSVKLELNEFGCGGGMWKPPPPGTYRMSYRLFIGSPPPLEKFAVARRTPSELTAYCRQTLLSTDFWAGSAQSNVLEVDLR